MICELESVKFCIGVLAVGLQYPDVSMMNDLYSDQDLISVTTTVSC